MNSDSLESAAASTATAQGSMASADSQNVNPRGQRGGSTPAIEEHEIDLGATATCRDLRDRTVDAIVRLQELDPGDEGELSGSVLRIIESFKGVGIVAEGGEVEQPDGHRSRHCFGWLNGASTRRLMEDTAAGASITMDMRESYSEWGGPDEFTGAALSISGGRVPEVRLCFGAHCLGVLRGHTVWRFLDCIKIRGGGTAA